LLGLIVVGAVAQAHADTAVCIGKLTKVANHANLGLHVVIESYPIVSICSFNASQFRITPEDCKHMASLAAIAFATDTPVVLYVDNAPTTNCADIPNWHVSDTRYFAVYK
jgi:hypothetical protein